MKSNHPKINRRRFLKTIGAAGFGSALAAGDGFVARHQASAAGEGPKTKFAQVPKRNLGKTGVEVSCLSLGCNRLDNETVLRGAHRWGVTYWDTASYYLKGNCERTIGAYLAKKPEARKAVFIVTKASGAKSIEDLEKLLQGSLKRLNTEYIDLYQGMHSLGEHAHLTLSDDVRAWVERAKERKLIRFFGFSTHKNIVQNLTAASKLDWIDVVMTAYNFRLMQDPAVQDAIEACYQAGIGIVAMKAIGLTVAERKKMESGEKEKETEEDRNIFRHFLERGLTEEQAKIKYVLEDQRISSVCVGMNNVALLTINAAAALDKNTLTHADREILERYANETCSRYCAGCAYLCDSVLPDTPYVSELMRYMMYFNSYGEEDRAKELFARIPTNVRHKLLNVDYRPAEALCPQRLPIGEIVTQAVTRLS